MTTHSRTPIRLSPDLLALAGYALLALLTLAHPLFNAATHLPAAPVAGSVSDYYHFHWNFWWIGHALTNGLDVYHMNYVFAPFASSLALHTLSAAWYPVWWVGAALFGGTVAGMNTVFFAALLLTAFAGYVFLRDLGVTPALAFTGGAAFGFSSLMLLSIGWTNINLMAGFWLPVLLLTWRRIVRAATWRVALGWGAALGAAGWAMLLTDLQYPLLFAPVVLPYGLVTLWGARQRAGRAIAALLLAGGLAIALLMATGTLSALLGIDRTGGSPTPADRAAEIRFPDCLIAYCGGGVYASVVLVPVALAVLVAGAARRRLFGNARRERWLWLAIAITPLVLALGAAISVGGARLPMPYGALHDALGGIFRYPERFLTAFALPLLAFSLLTLSALPVRARRGVAVALFAVWLIDARILVPMPLMPIPPVYAIYEAIGHETLDQVIVEIPTGGSSGEGYVGRPEYSALQWYGITHGRRMVNGHLSRVNTYHYFYMNYDDPMMAWLGQRRFLEPETVRAQMVERIPEWRIGYFLVHRDLIAPDQNAIDEITGFFNMQGDLLCPPVIERDLVAYRTRWHADGCPADRTPPRHDGAYVLPIGSADDARFVAGGWSYPEALFDLDVRWMSDRQAALVFDLPRGTYTLALRAQAYQTARTVRVEIDGTAIGLLTIAQDGLAEYTLPAPLTVNGDPLTLTLTPDGALPAGERALSVMVEEVRLTQAE
jgi:hypothetical protein